MRIQSSGRVRWLTEKIDDEASVGETTSWFAEDGTTIGEVDWEAEPTNEIASVRVGIAEREDNGSVVALRENWVWERNEKP